MTFHGHVDDVTKHHVLQGSWVHVLPSRKEGWGLAVVEAGQHGVPTIGYRSSGGLSDSIIDGVTGMLVDDRAELVDSLEQLLSDPVLRDQLGAKAQARSMEFSWAQSAEALRDRAWKRCKPESTSAAWSDPTLGGATVRPASRPPRPPAAPATQDAATSAASRRSAGTPALTPPIR